MVGVKIGSKHTHKHTHSGSHLDRKPNKLACDSFIYVYVEYCVTTAESILYASMFIFIPCEMICIFSMNKKTYLASWNLFIIMRFSIEVNNIDDNNNNDDK